MADSFGDLHRQTEDVEVRWDGADILHGRLIAAGLKPFLIITLLIINKVNNLD